MGMTDADRATSMLETLLASDGPLSCGITFAHTGRWAQGDRRLVTLESGRTLLLDHDEREAPVRLNTSDNWDDTLLVSLTDEEETCACAWVRVPDDSLVVGLGIDLASTHDFAGEHGARFNRLLFTQREHELAPIIGGGNLALGYAYAFAAKEAAFKALAAPLRRWYQTHQEELLFDVRCFELADATHESGTARKGEAQRAMDKLGVASIELGRMTLGNRALTVAVARKA